MDCYIDIIISEDDLNSCGIIESTITWGGEEIGKSPREFVKGDIKFCMLDTNFYTCAIKNRIVLRVSSELHDIEVKSNINKESIDENNIYQLVEEITKLSEFMIVIGIYDEEIQDIVEYDEGDDLKRIFYKALNWDTPVGSVIRRVK